jgi:hypothetical protein
MFTRHDAWRWAPPGSPAAKMPGWADPSATRVRLREAQEEEARALEAAAQQELNRELLQVHRELAELKYELAWRQLRRKYGYTPGRQVDRKWDGQPRDGRGRFDFGKKPDADSEPTLARLPGPPPLRVPVVPPPPAGVENALQEYAAASRWNSSERRAILEFNARAFEPAAAAGDPAVHVGVLTKDNVDEACPRYWEVQSLTNQAADLYSPGAYSTPQERGTAIHTWVRDEINGSPTVPPSTPKDPDFKSEQSFIKSKEADYGDKGSVRVDVYENRRNGIVCIYDIKTGETGLSFARMQELASNVGTSYPGTMRIIVTEVRPQR